MLFDRKNLMNLLLAHLLCGAVFRTTILPKAWIRSGWAEMVLLARTILI